MPGPVSTAYVELRADTSRMNRDVTRASQTAGDNAGSSFMGGFGGAVAGLAATVGAGALIQFGVETAGALEQTQIGFEGILGSGEAAEEMMGRLTQFAATTPFEMPGLSDMSRNLLAVGGGFGDLNDVLGRTDSSSGVTSDNLLDVATIIGDLTSTLGGSQTNMDAVTRALGQMGGLGRVTAGDMNQIANALPGFNAWQAVADQMGMTVAEVRELSEQGKLAADEAIPALLSGMRDFPGAAGAMERQAVSLNGIISTFKDTAALALSGGLTPLLEGLKTILPAISAPGGPLETLAGSFGEFASGVFDSLAPALEPLMAAVGTVLDDLGVAFEALSPVIAPIADLFGVIATTVSGALADAFTALAPAIEIVGDFIADLTEVLGEEFGEILEEIMPLVATIAEIFTEALAEVLPDLVDVFRSLLNVLRPLLRTGLEVLVSVLETLAPILPQIIQGFIALRVAQLALNVAMSANPVGLVIAAIAGLVVGIKAAYDNFEPFRNIVDSAWQSLQAVWDIVVNAVTPAFQAIAGWVGDAVTAIGNFVTTNETFRDIVRGVIENVIGFFQGLRDFVSGTVDFVRALFDGKWREALGILGGLARGVIDNVVGFFSGLLPRLTTALGAVGTFLLEKGKDLLNGLWAGIQAVWDDPVLPWLRSLPGLVVDAIVWAGSGLLALGRDAIDLIWQGMQALWDDPVLPWLRSLPGLIVDAIQWTGTALLDIGTRILRAVWNGITAFWRDTLQPWLASLPGLIVAAIRWTGTALLDLGGRLLRTVWNGITAFWDETLQPWLADLPGMIVDAIVWVGSGLLDLGGRLLRAVWNGVVGFWDTEMSGWFSDLPGNIADLIVTVGSGLWSKGQEILNAIGDGIEQIWDNIEQFFIDLPSTLADLIVTVGSGLWSKGQDLLIEVGNGINEIWDDIQQFFIDLPGNVADLIVAVGSGLWTKGQELLAEVGKGLQAVWSSTTGVRQWLEGLPASMASALLENVQNLIDAGEDLASAWWTAFTDWVKPKIQAFVDGLDIVLPFINFPDDIFGGDETAEARAQIDEVMNSIAASGSVTFADRFTESLANQFLTVSFMPESARAAADNFINRMGLTGQDGAEELANAITEALQSEGFMSTAEFNQIITDFSDMFTDGAADVDTEGFASTLSFDTIDTLARHLATDKANDLDPFFRDMPSGFASEAGRKSKTAMRTPGLELIEGLTGGVNTNLKVTKKVITGLQKNFLDWMGDLRNVFKLSGAILIDGLREGLTGRFPQLRLNIFSIRQRAIEWLGDLNPIWVSRGTALVNGLVLGINSRFPQLRTMISNIRTDLATRLGDMSTAMWREGYDTISGLLRGMVDRIGSLREFLSNLRQDIATRLGDTSFLLYGEGWDVIQGLLNGMRSADDFLITYLNNLDSEIRDAVGDQSNTLYNRGVELVNGLLSGIKDRIARLEIRAIALMSFARGGIVPGTGPQMAVVHGGELILNAQQQAGIAALGPMVARWQGTALQALRMAAQSSRWTLDLLTQMKHESGGNPNAVNRWDINWRLGHPSKGLMQTIQSTFDAYAGDLVSRGIFDPLANIFAAIRYTVARYGDLGYWRRNDFQGYALGGLVPGVGPRLAVVHGGERVLTPQQQRDWGGITFGPGAISVTFAGGVPTEGQAFTVGSQVGRGIVAELEKQRIRTMARTS